MKKLTMLLMVLAMSLTADAADLELSVNGSRDGSGNTTEITIDVDTMITIGVYCITVDYPKDIFFIGIERNKWDGNGVWIDDTNTIYEPPAPEGSQFSPYDEDWFVFESPGSDELGDIGKWFDMDFRCTSLGDVAIDLYDYDEESQFILQDSVLVHQVPEPATILLLGLGGLLLRRRKR